MNKRHIALAVVVIVVIPAALALGTLFVVVVIPISHAIAPETLDQNTYYSILTRGT